MAIALGIVITALVLYGVAALVRDSGAGHILTIDYAKIADPQALHQWAGMQFRRMAHASMALAVAALAMPDFAMAMLYASVLLVLAGCIALGLGARKFRRA